MKFTVRPFRQADAQQIAQWHDEGPYAFYDMENDQDRTGRGLGLNFLERAREA